MTAFFFKRYCFFAHKKSTAHLSIIKIVVSPPLYRAIMIVLYYYMKKAGGKYL